MIYTKEYLKRFSDRGIQKHPPKDLLTPFVSVFSDRRDWNLEPIASRKLCNIAKIAAFGTSQPYTQVWSTNGFNFNPETDLAIEYGYILADDKFVLKCADTVIAHVEAHGGDIVKLLGYDSERQRAWSNFLSNSLTRDLEKTDRELVDALSDEFDKRYPEKSIRLRVASLLKSAAKTCKLLAMKVDMIRNEQPKPNFTKTMY